MTTLFLQPAMPLHGPVDRQHASWVGLVEASEAIGATGRIQLGSGEHFDRARLLVRDSGSIRGYVSVPVQDGSLNAPAVASAVHALPAAAERTRPAPRLITVVVCTRDRAALLRESLASIRAIDYPRMEVVVVDNAPATSETRLLLENDFPDFRYIRQDAPGLAHARNAGLHAASAAIVAFTDDDVIVDRQWLWSIATGFARAEDVGCVSGVVPSGELRNDVQNYFDARVSWSKLTAERVFRLSDPPADLPMFPFSVGEFGTGANFALRRDHMLRLGGFDTALGAGTRSKGGEDLDMFLRMLYDAKAIVVEPAAIVWHRHRDDLDALREQAVGYGRGLGAWATTVALDPRMLSAAVARSPRAVARLLNKPMTTVDDPAGPRQAQLFEHAVAVGHLELRSVFSGPSSYFAERHAQRHAGTFGGPPSRGPRLERRCWSAAAVIAGVSGLLAAVPSPTWVSLTLLAIFVLIGPGALLRAWVSLPPHLGPIVVPAIGISATLLVVTALASTGWWSPVLSLLLMAITTSAIAVASARILARA